MKISLLLLIAGIGIACAKYIPYEESDLQSLSRVRRSDSNESVPSGERNNSNEDDNNSNDGDSKEEKLRKKLQQQEKDRIRQEERQRKLTEKRIKEEHKQQEKREKEERKRLERLEKEHQKLERAQRKAEEKLRKAERKRQEALREELDELRNDAVHESAEDFLDTEEESSVEAADVWRNHIYVKYGLNHASTRLEKHAAIRKYMQEELGLKPNSTNSERRQAIINHVKTKLSSDPAVRKVIGEQLVSHLSPAGVQKMQTGLVEDIEELDNKTALLNNISLPWAEQAKAQIQDKRRFLFAMSQFLSDILQPQNTNKEANNGQNGINSANANSPSSDVVSSTLPCANANNVANTATGADNANNLSSDQANSNTVSTENAGGLTQTAANEGSQPQGNTVNQDIPSIDASTPQSTGSKPLPTQTNSNNPTQTSASGTLPAQDNVNSQQDNLVDNGASQTQAVASEISQTQSNTVKQDSAVIDTTGQVLPTGTNEIQSVSSGALPAQNNVPQANDPQNSAQTVAIEPSQTQGNAVNQDSSDTAGQPSQTGASEPSSAQNTQQVTSTSNAGNPAPVAASEQSQAPGNVANQAAAEQASQIGASTSSSNNIENPSQVVSDSTQIQGNTVNDDTLPIDNAGQVTQTANGIETPASHDNVNSLPATSVNSADPTQTGASESSQTQSNVINQESSSANDAVQSVQTSGSETVPTQNIIVNDEIAGSINQESTNIKDASVTDSTSQTIINEFQSTQSVATEILPGQTQDAASVDSGVNNLLPNQGNSVSQGGPAIDDTIQPTQTSGSEVAQPNQINTGNQQVASESSTQTVGTESSQPQGEIITQDSSIVNSEGQTTQTGVSETSAPQDNLVNQGASADGSSTQAGVNGGPPAQAEEGANNNQEPSTTNDGQADQTSVTEPSSIKSQEISSTDTIDTAATQSTIENGSIDSATQAGSGDGPTQSTTLDEAPIHQGNVENNIVLDDGNSPVVVDVSPEYTTSQAVPVENADANLETTEIASVTESSPLSVESQTNDASQGNPEEAVTDNVDSITTDAVPLLDPSTLEVASTENNAENNTSATTEVPNSGDTVNPLENVILSQENTESSTTTGTDGEVNQEAQTEATPGLIPVENAIENIENTTDVVETTEAQSSVDITTEAIPETVTDGITIPVEPGASIVEITQQ